MFIALPEREIAGEREAIRPLQDRESGWRANLGWLAEWQKRILYYRGQNIL
jgi:hypothetical protein